MSKVNPSKPLEGPQVSLSKMTGKSWTILGLFAIFFGVALWQAILPYMAEYHYHEGYNYEVSKRLNIAIEEYEASVRYAPWETQYQLDLAKMYTDYAAEQTSLQDKIMYLKKAETVCLHMVDLDPKNPWYKNKLATTYLSLAENQPEKSGFYLDKADFYIRSAAETDHHNPLFQLNLAFFLHRMKKFDEAFMYYKKTIEFDDNLLEAPFNLADIYIKRTDYDSALKCYLTVAQKNPKFPNIGLAISSLAVEMYQHSHNNETLKVAIPSLELILKENSADLQILKQLAYIYSQLQDHKNTRRICEQILTFYPNLSEYRGLLNQLPAQN